MVADDHLVFAQALALAIDATGELACVGTAQDVEGAIGIADEFQPDVAVVDAHLDGADDLAGTRSLLERDPGLCVLVLTGATFSRTLARDVAVAGAAGLLPKSASLDQVVETLPLLRPYSFVVDRQQLAAVLGAEGDAVARGDARASSPVGKATSSRCSSAVSTCRALQCASGSP